MVQIDKLKCTEQDITYGQNTVLRVIKDSVAIAYYTETRVITYASDTPQVHLYFKWEYLICTMQWLIYGEHYYTCNVITFGLVIT